jgi:hypothetical protein
MKRTLAVVTGLLAAMLIAAPVSAGPPSGTTLLLGAPKAGTVVDVRVTLHTTAPVVAYEYAIQNECTYPKKTSTLQHDDIVNWTFVVGGDPAATMPIDLGSTLEGYKCKVFVMHGNVVIKGSTSSYVVLAP